MKWLRVPGYGQAFRRSCGVLKLIATRRGDVAHTAPSVWTVRRAGGGSPRAYLLVMRMLGWDLDAYQEWLAATGIRFATRASGGNVVG